MARARNIKPGIMGNEELAELRYEARLLFIYLWMLADCAGRLEDRPRRIRAQAFPYDDVDCDALLDALRDQGFISRYTVSGIGYIQVINFVKHQNISPKERQSGSSIPPEGDEPVADQSHPGDLPVPLNTEYPIPDTEIPSTDGKPPKYTGEDYAMAQEFYPLVSAVSPYIKVNIDKWADQIRLMRVADGIPPERIRQVFLWANKDDFWRKNILSMAKLREKFPQLDAKSHSGGKLHGRGYFDEPSAYTAEAERYDAALDSFLAGDNDENPI